VALDLDAGPGTSSVLVDDRRGGYLAMHHLLGLGHRRLAIVALETCSGARSVWSDAASLRAAEHRFARDRAAGYADALAEQGLALDALPILEVPNTRLEAARCAGELLAARPGTTAILTMSDVTAMGVLDAARARGLRVPQDLSVVGYDDIPEAAQAEPPLTTVAQPILEKGRLAARLIFAGGPPRTEVLGVELKVRATTAAPRG
jgi:DNA-binding LacI/PurR family transcriptional regulator